MDHMDIQTAREIVAAAEAGTAFDHAAPGRSSEEAHAWADGVEYGIRAARAIAAAERPEGAHRALRIRALEAIQTPERNAWLDPDDADILAEDIARAFADAPPVLRKTGTVELNRPGSGELFEITQADVTFSATNDVTRRQELNIVLVLERDLPPRDSGIRTSAAESGA